MEGRRVGGWQVTGCEGLLGAANLHCFSVLLLGFVRCIGSLSGGEQDKEGGKCWP